MHLFHRTIRMPSRRKVNIDNSEPPGRHGKKQEKKKEEKNTQTANPFGICMKRKGKICETKLADMQIPTP